MHTSIETTTKTAAWNGERMEITYVEVNVEWMEMIENMVFFRLDVIFSVRDDGVEWRRMCMDLNSGFTWAMNWNIELNLNLNARKL